MGEVRTGTLQSLWQFYHWLDVCDGLTTMLSSRREYLQKRIDSFNICGLIDADAHATIVQIVQVHFLAQCDSFYLLDAYTCGQLNAKGVEVGRVLLAIAIGSQGFI